MFDDKMGSVLFLSGINSNIARFMNLIIVLSIEFEREYSHWIRYCAKSIDKKIIKLVSRVINWILNTTRKNKNVNFEIFLGTFKFVAGVIHLASFVTIIQIQSAIFSSPNAVNYSDSWLVDSIGV